MSKVNLEGQLGSAGNTVAGVGSASARFICVIN